MDYLMAAPAAVCCGAVAYCTLNQKIADKIRLLHIMGTPAEKSKDMSGRQVLWLTLLIGILCYGAAVMVFFHVDGGINRMKMLIALFCIAGAACNDYREQRIPNIFPFVMALSGLLCLAAGYLFSQEGAGAYIASSLIATVLVAACMTVAALLTGNGIGIGDIKLLCALALTGGVYTVGGTLFFGMAVCFFAAIALLLFQKKTMKESLPFGPFIFIGYIITIFASVY